MASSESVFELGIEFSEANNVLLMSLMEEIREEEHHGDDRLVNIIKSLEAEIGDPLSGQMYEVGHVDGQGCSTSISDPDHWVYMELISSSPFDELNACIPYGDEMEDTTMEYEGGSDDIDDFQLYHEVFLEQQYREAYLSQGPSDDAVF